jgi:hypothetical protein
VTHNSLVASQRPHISLIDRRHFDYAALPIAPLMKRKAASYVKQGLSLGLDSVKPYQRPGFAAPS